jgi:RNA polymerase sigma factor (sigma-70 family)
MPRPKDEKNRGAAGIPVGIAVAPPRAQSARDEKVPSRRLSTPAAAFYARVWSTARFSCTSLLRGLGCSESDAEEVFADAYATTMARIDPIERGFKEPQIVRRLQVACRWRMSELRRRQRVVQEIAIGDPQPPANLDADEPHEGAERSEAIAIGKEALESLSPTDRLIFQLRYQQDFSPAEIRERIPSLTREGYRKAIQRSNKRVLAAYRQIESGERCKELARGALIKYVSGAAGPELAQAVQAHLRHCRACRQRTPAGRTLDPDRKAI